MVKNTSSEYLRPYKSSRHIKFLLLIAIVVSISDSFGRDLYSLPYNSSGIMKVDLGWLDTPLAIIEIFIIITSIICFIAPNNTIHTRILALTPMMVVIIVLAMTPASMKFFQKLKLYIFDDIYHDCARLQQSRDLNVCSATGYSGHKTVIIYDSGGKLGSADTECGKNLNDLALSEGIYHGEGRILCNRLFDKYYYIEHHYN